MAEEQPEKWKRISRIILIIATIFFALAIIPGIFVTLMSVMIFDSGVNNKLIVLYSFIATFPLICLLSFVSWMFYGFKKYGIAIFISLLPVLNFIGLLVMLIISSVF
jgi:hypothetical protein